MKIAIIGGGPIGMEAALYGACAGFDVRLYERGRLAENVRQWGHIGVFTEWRRNRSPLAVKLLQERGDALPPDESTCSGDELADYVLKLASLEPLRGRIAPQTEVAHLTRERCLKSDFIALSGNNEAEILKRRAEFPFRLLLRGVFGEKIAHADVVIDATGVWATPNPLGSGGAPCPGEEKWARKLDYHLPDVAGRDKPRFANRHTVVVGSGHSAASTLRSIGGLFEEFPQTRVTWIVRRDVPEHGLPYTLVEDDPSPHRDALHRRANELSEHSHVQFLPRTVVESVDHNGKVFRLTAQNDTGSFRIECDNVAVHTGFRPDQHLWRELQIQVHPATEAPLAMAREIIAQNRRAGVGLSTGYAEKQPQDIDGSEILASTLNDVIVENDAAHDRWRFVQNDPDVLHSGEPNFFVLGIKSYGRDAGFLMQNGFRQVRDLYKLLGGTSTLDLYEGKLDQ